MSNINAGVMQPGIMRSGIMRPGIMKGAGGPVVPAFLTGFTASNTANTKKMIANVQNGISSEHLAFGGNSTKAGWGSNGTAFGIPATLLGASRRALGQAVQWAALLASEYGITVSTDNFWGDAGLDVPFTNLTTFDPRISTTGTVTFSSSFTGPGGKAWVTQDATSTITFTPGKTFTKLTLAYPNNATTFSVTGDVDTVAQHSIAGPGTGAPTKTVFEFTAANNSVTFKGDTATGLRIHGGWTETDGEIVLHLHTMGWGNSTTAQWANTALGGNPAAIINLIAPKLFMYGEDINDPNMGVNPATTHTTNLTNIFNHVTGTGTDKVLYMDNYTASSDVDGATGHATLAVIQATQAASRGVGASLGIGVIDSPSVFVSFAQQKAKGQSYDVSHLLGAGQAFQAQNILMPFIRTAIAA